MQSGSTCASCPAGQKFCLDIALVVDLAAAGRSDDLRHTVSYAEVFT